MGKTHLRPLIAVIIQSAKLTESEQTKVCSEAHDSFGIGADVARNRAALANLLCKLCESERFPDRSDPVCFSDRIISSKARFGCE
ncbi:MAG: hypothetical protein IIZ75_08865, partial [Lachnospiraceae bacterium]|nr:hypothetical protein [Lachnospiraceae bacterium]